MVDVVLTTDETLMSNYHGMIVLGFGTSAPQSIIPESLFRFLIFPGLRSTRGSLRLAPLGLRKIEARLVESGYSVATVPPAELRSHLPDARLLGVSTMDPLGLGPSSFTWRRILGGEPYTSRFFRGLMTSPEVVEARRRGCRVLVGGQGAWQLERDPESLDRYGIDCLVLGEGERVVPRLVEAALSGRELPRVHVVSGEEVPALEEIPDITGGTICGITEIGRGCPRGCRFCTVTLQALRWYPLDRIEREIMVNRRAGVRDGTLHAEDVLLYGSRGVKPDRSKVLALTELALRHYRHIGWSHLSLAAVASDPALIEMVMERVLERQSWLGMEVGIETGSPRLIAKYMPGKARPFRPEEWPEVVEKAFGIMHDNRMVPYCTLIVGLPDETDEDTVKTIELLDDIKGYKSVIVPLFFVPWGKMSGEEGFDMESLTEPQMELLRCCLNYSLHWINEFAREFFSEIWYRQLLYPGYLFLLSKVRRMARAAGFLEEDYMTAQHPLRAWTEGAQRGRRAAT
ncbi:MAG: B12-binding domain-containing radical SAM protein [Thermoplasmatota archaeon]